MRSRLLPLGIWGVALAIAIVLVCRARYTADLSAFLPALPTQEQQLLVEELQEGPAARVILVAISGADAGRRAALSVGLVQRLQADRQFRTVTNGAAGPTEADREFLFRYRYLLSERIDGGFFAVPHLNATISDTLGLLASPFGMLAQDLFARDPTGETLQVITQLDHPDGPRLADGVWVSRDGQRALLVAETAAAGSDTDGQQRAIAAIHAAFAALQPDANAASAPPAALRLTGPAVFAVDARATIQNEAVRLSLLSSLLIAAFLLAVYRSVAVLALGMLPVATGALAGVAVVALGFGVVHGVTLGFGVTLIGESVDYSVYLFLQGQRAAGGGRDHAGWTAQFWPTIRLGMLTSVAGFASLLPSGFPGLAQLGAYSIAGLAAAALVTRFVLPGLLPARLGIADVAPLGTRFLRAIAPLRRVRRLLWLVPLMTCACLLTHRGELWNHELAALSPVPAESQAFDARLRADLGTADVRTLVIVSATSQERALQAAEQVGAALQPLVAGGVIAGFDSPARYLPSERTQRARQAALPQPADLRARFLAATATLPLRQERFDGFLEDVAAARQLPPASRQRLQGTTLAAGVDALLVARGAHWQALVPLEAMHSGPSAYMIDTGRVGAALGRVHVDGASVVVLDLKRESDALYAGYLGQSLRLSLAGLGAILVLLTVALRSLRRTLRVVLPLVLSVMVIISGFVVVGHAMTILNLVGLLLVVAIGSNYCLFFDREATQPGGVDSARTLASLLVANASTVIGFGVLATSSVPVLSAVGQTVAPGTLLALLFGALLAGDTPAAQVPQHA